MEVGIADRTKLAEKKKDGPSRAMLKSLLLSVLSVLCILVDGIISVLRKPC
jgi:hypothetical protein